jgi:hypothetical protein
MVTRVAAIALAVGASYDVYALNGRYELPSRSSFQFCTISG